MGSFVRLSSGLHGVVTDLNPVDPLRPKVRVAYDENMQPLEVKDEDLSQAICPSWTSSIPMITA